MAKLFVTDEVNPSYTANVSDKGQIRTMSMAQSHTNINSAATSAVTVVNAAACWLKSVIIGELPATASCLILFDRASSAASANALDVSGSAKIAKISIPAVAAATTAQVQNITIPFDVYCASGLCYNIGGDGTLIGNVNNVTIIYQDL
jgi:hypothetical protein